MRDLTTVKLKFQAEREEMMEVVVVARNGKFDRYDEEQELRTPGL